MPPFRKVDAKEAMAWDIKFAVLAEKHQPTGMIGHLFLKQQEEIENLTTDLENACIHPTGFIQKSSTMDVATGMISTITTCDFCQHSERSTIPMDDMLLLTFRKIKNVLNENKIVLDEKNKTLLYKFLES